MGAVQTVKLSALPAAIRADMRRLKKTVEGAVRRSAKLGVQICRGNVPAEFSEIGPGIVVVHEGKNVVIRSHAPHSNAVECGAGFSVTAVKTRGGGGTITSFTSVPEGLGNVPDVGSVIEWVRRFGSGRGNVGKDVRRALRGYVQRANRNQGRSSPIDAPKQLAFAIVGSLKKHNKPYRFMLSSVPQLERILGDTISNALDSSAPLGDAAALLAATSSLPVGKAVLTPSARRLAATSGRRARKR